MVSISTITYNHAPYIHQCLDGMLMQKCNFNFEILIHDDASTDGTESIIREYERIYPEIIKPIYEKENQWIKGRRGSITFNFPRARGKYIALCEGDDYWTDPLKLQKQVDFLENHPEYVLTFHDARIVDETDHFISGGGLPEKLKKDGSGVDIIAGKWLPTLTVMFRNGLIKGIPEEYHGVLNGDAFLYALLGHFGGAKYIPGINPSHYRKHTGGIWSALSPQERYREMINTRKKVLRVVDKRYKWIIRQLIFADNVYLTPYVNGFLPKVKQYFHSYRYFVFRIGFLPKYMQAHFTILQKLFRKANKNFHGRVTVKKNVSHELI